MDIILFCAVVLPKYLLYIHDMYVSDVSAENIHAVYPLPVCAKGECEDTVQWTSPYLPLPPPPSPSPLSSDCVLASCRYILHLHDPRSPPAGEARHRLFHTAFTSSVRLMFSRDKILHCALWRCSLCVLVSHTNTHARIHKGACNVHICRGIFCQFFSIFLVHCVLSAVAVHPSVFPWRRWCTPSAICEERERKWRCNFTFCILSRCSKLDEFC